MLTNLCSVYIIAPFFAWFVAGSLKFLINSLRLGKPAFKLIGYGGFPSNHSTIVSTITFLVGLREGWHSSTFGVALAFSFIVILDALDLRREVGKHAQKINQLLKKNDLRERIGHSKLEVLGGLATGLFCAWILNTLF